MVTLARAFGNGALALLLVPAAALAAALEPYVYVGSLDARSAVLAWGELGGPGNRIGREAVPEGAAEVRVGERRLRSERSWIRLDGLAPDTEYPYQVWIGERKLGEGSFRTWPEQSDRLTFFVIGDFGNGSRAQYQIADAMSREFSRRESSSSPVRFVITTGDNLYASRFLFWLRASGQEDRDWAKKFFQPYRDVLRHIPFYPSVGNHDGSESEPRRDLSTYLDNFFFPQGQPARFYNFSFAGLADFFALDSTPNVLEPGDPAIYRPNGEQHLWLKKALSDSRAPWKIPYFHHDLFTAGPEHAPEMERLRHFFDTFREGGVRAVFNGHEHNFQMSEASDYTGYIRFFISGAGGQLRSGDVRGALKSAHIDAWSAQYHFLAVEIDGRSMRVTPIGFDPIAVQTSEGPVLGLPIEVALP